MANEEAERYGTREDAARLLRAAADAVEAGEIEMQRGDGSITVGVPNSLDIEVELESEADERELEIELEWTEDTADESPPEGGEQPWRREGASGAEEPPIGPADGPESLARFELFRDRADEWRWRLVHRNGNIIATSGERYVRRAGAENGLKSVVHNAPGADIEEG